MNMLSWRLWRVRPVVVVGLLGVLLMLGIFSECGGGGSGDWK